MHRFITLACAVAAATLLVVGCGSSGDDSSPASGGSGGTSSGVACVGDYADLTQAAFTAKVSADGQCVADANTVCSNDVTMKAESCGLNCLETGVADMDGCVGTCLNGAVSPALSAGCLGCYVTDVGCARDNCKFMCISPSSPACTTCREQNGCIAAFYTCSGLPLPSASAGQGAAGAGDVPTGSAGAGG